LPNYLANTVLVNGVSAMLLALPLPPKSLYTPAHLSVVVVGMPARERKGKRVKQTSIKIDAELWKQAKIEAIKRGITLGELLELALRKELGLEGGVANELS